jgi:hypothetical protein
MNSAADECGYDEYPNAIRRRATESHLSPWVIFEPFLEDDWDYVKRLIPRLRLPGW